MSAYNDPQPAERGLTLNDLKELRCSLNMRLLLAIQLHDTAAQAALEEEIRETDERIERMLAECGVVKPRAWI